MDNKDYFWVITWISKYYYVILYNKQHILSQKSMKLFPGNTAYKAKHIPDACEHSGKNSCCNLISMGINKKIRLWQLFTTRVLTSVWNVFCLVCSVARQKGM